MKIAQVCPYDFSRPGGVKNHIISLSKELMNLGHEVKIITPGKVFASEDLSLNSFGKNRGIQFSGTKIDINIALGEERKLLKKFLKNENFDIIHYHTFWNPVLPFQIWYHSNAKNIATFHDTPKSRLVGKTIMPLAASLVINMMDRVISVSKTQARYIGGVNHKKVSIIPNGIDLSLSDSSTTKINRYNDEKFNLLFLGRLEPRKGVHYTLMAFKELKKQHPDLRLIIAGDGQERSLVSSFIKENQLEDIEVLGEVDERTKLDLLKTTDLYLAPALYGESFGIVLLEAMANGLPIAGFGNEGYLNVIPDNWKTFFPPPGDHKKLVAAIQKLIENPDLRNEMIEWGLVEVKKYDWKILAPQIEEIYLTTLK